MVIVEETESAVIKSIEHQTSELLKDYKDELNEGYELLLDDIIDMARDWYIMGVLEGYDLQSNNVSK